MTDASTASELTGPDPSWRGLYTAGGLCAGLYVLLGVVIPMGQVILEQYDFYMDATTFLEFIVRRRTWWIVLQTLLLGSGVLAVVVFVALFVALKHVDKSRAALGAMVAVVSQNF
jgi:ABC-type Fe3+ transport system permease subunit